MTRFHLTIQLCVVVLCVLGPAMISSVYAASKAKRPHIVVLVSDDQAWGDTGYDGHPHLPTPNLDALARNGVRLNRFYVSNPKCSPSRAGVLTGRQPHRWKFLNGPKLNQKEVTIANILGGAGYQCGHFGKWQMGSVQAGSAAAPSSRGFHFYRSVKDAPDMQPNGSFSGEDGKTYPYTGDSSVASVQAALSFISSAVAAGKPSLSLVWYGSPHGTVKSAVDEDHKAIPSAAKQRLYLAKIHGIDRSIGLLRQGLRRLKIEKDTLVIYFSDNGYKGGHGGLRGGKQTLWEGGVRVPGAAEWPGVIPAGSVSDVPVSGMDILPTAITLAGIRQPKLVGPLDGIDILPILQGKQQQRTHAIPLAYFGVNGLVVGDFKVMLGNPDAKPTKTLSLQQVLQKSDWSLYNVAKDPAETTNLIGKSLPQEAQMKQALRNWMQAAITDSYKK